MARKPILLLDEGDKPVLKFSDGRKESLSHSAPPEKEQIVLLIDCSASMQGDKLHKAKKGAVEFAGQAVSDGNQVGVVSFALRALVRAPLSSNITDIARCVNDIVVEGFTNLAEGVAEACKLFTGPGPHTLVVVTDGQPITRTSPDDREAAKTLALLAADAAKARGIKIVCVGTDDADHEFLKQIASQDVLARHVDQERLDDGIASTYKLLTN